MNFDVEAEVQRRLDLRRKDPQNRGQGLYGLAAMEPHEHLGHDRETAVHQWRNGEIGRQHAIDTERIVEGRSVALRCATLFGLAVWCPGADGELRR